MNDLDTIISEAGKPPYTTYSPVNAKYVTREIVREYCQDALSGEIRGNVYLYNSDPNSNPFLINEVANRLKRWLANPRLNQMGKFCLLFEPAIFLDHFEDLEGPDSYAIDVGWLLQQAKRDEEAALARRTEKQNPNQPKVSRLSLKAA